ncbi:MAG: YihY/virulence factor BrkB family protein, partial [Victivallales bacterium]|nr:YihY/virulence factor BrkB family protein [Victivallales bacterium]
MKKKIEKVKEVIPKVKEVVPKVKKFLFEDVWLEDVTSVSFWKRLRVHLTRVGVTAVKSYKQDKCGLQASALTYITLVSLVPMIAIMFSFTKGLGMQRLLLDKIGMEKVHLEVANAEGENFEFRVLQPVKDEEGNITSKPDGFAHLMPEPVQKAMIGILTYAEHTNFAALGLVGSFMLLVSVITSIAKLEDCFNRIWGVTKPR